MAAATTPTPNYVNPETRVPELLGVQIGLTVASFLIVSARMYTRTKIMRFWGPDDLAILVAMLFAIIETTLGCMATRYGTGLHLWDVPPNLSLAPSLKMSFVVQILYMPILLLTRLSILLFYRRLSPNAQYMRTVKIVIGVSIVFGTAVTLGDIFQCTPVAFVYDSTIPGGKCFDQMMFFKSTAIINIVNDFIVFILPLPTLWRLKMPMAQKLALGFILGLGAFVCVASCIRLSLLFRLSQTNDVTWFGVDLSNWSCIEYNIGIMCASLPALKPLMGRMLPSVFGRTKTGSSGISGLSGSAKKSGNMYALGSLNGGATGGDQHYGNGVAITCRESDEEDLRHHHKDATKDSESEEHIINYSPNGITKTMDIMVDVEEHGGSISTIQSGRRV